MIGGRQWAIKKFLRGYAVTIVTSALLILVLALLIWARLGDLYSVRDISKINPLITSGQNELVAIRDENGISTFVKENNQSAQSKDGSDGSKNDTPDKSDAGNPQSSDGGTSTNTNSGTSTGGGGTTTGGGSNGGTGGNSGGGPSPSPSSSPTPGVFSAGISNVWQTDPLRISLIGTSCKTTHSFYATVGVQNAPGAISYRWKQSNGVTSAAQPLSFSAGDSSKTVAATPWEISGPAGSYSITFELISPVRQQKTVTFQHDCPLIGGGGL